MATLEQRTVALQHLVVAKQVLGFTAEEFAYWLMDQAMEIAPALFEMAADLADDDEMESRAVN